MVLRQPCCPSNSCSTGRIFLAFPSPYSRNLMPWSWLVSRMYHACTTHVPRMYHTCTWLVSPNPLPCTWLVCRMYLALGAFLFSAFYFLLSLGGGFRRLQAGFCPVKAPDIFASLRILR